MSDVDPQEAARIATEAHTEAEGIPSDVAVPEDSEPEPDSSRGSRLVDGLLETEPDSSVREFSDLSEPASNVMIGVVKFLNGVLGGDRQISGGKPALINFLQALLAVMSSDPKSGSSSSDPDSEPEPRSPSAGVGGEIPNE